MASSINESTSAPPPERSTSAPPSLEELSRRGVRSLFLPYIIELMSTSPTQNPPSPREILVLVDVQTGSITMVEGSGEIESFFRGKEGPLPASKASIDAMRKVEVREEEAVECPICLVEFGGEGEGEDVREMPCMHKYHGRCIEKWLGIHGSCPICRFQMPVEEESEKDIKNGSNEEEGESDESDGDNDGDDGAGTGFVFHIYVAGSRRRGWIPDPDTIQNENDNGDTNDENSGSVLVADMDSENENGDVDDEDSSSGLVDDIDDSIRNENEDGDVNDEVSDSGWVADMDIDGSH